MSNWVIGGKEVQSLHINGKEVQSIVRLSDNVVLYEKTQSLSLTLSANTDSAFTGMSITVEGTLKSGATNLVSKSIKIYNGATLLTTLTTDANGVFTGTITASNNDMSLMAVFEGDSVYDSINSDNLMINIVSDYIELVWEGTTLSAGYNNPLINNNHHDVIIDYGDGTIAIGHNYGHTYSTNSEHTIRIYNATELGGSAFSYKTGLKSVNFTNSYVNKLSASCFLGCENLTEIILPESLTTISDTCFDSCGITTIIIPEGVTTFEGIEAGYGGSLVCRPFYDCDNLEEIILNWDTSNEIIEYDSNWIKKTGGGILTNFNYFIIPSGTTSLYIAKGYPSNLLLEFDGIQLTSDKSILSYADNEHATLTAQLTNNGSAVAVSGEAVTFEAYKSSDNSLITANWGVNYTNVVCSSGSNLSSLIGGNLNEGESAELTIGTVSSNGITIVHTPQGVGQSSQSTTYFANVGDVFKITKDDAYYYIYKNNNLVDSFRKGHSINFEGSGISFSSVEVHRESTSLTAYTDALGVATVYYSSNGAGDINIKAQCRSLIQTYTVEDCLKVWTLDSNTQIRSISNGSGSISVSNGVYSGGASILLDSFTNTSTWVLEADVNFSRYGGIGLGVCDTGMTSRDGYRGIKLNSSGSVGYGNNSSTWNSVTPYITMPSDIFGEYHPIKFIKENGGIRIVFNEQSSASIGSQWNYINAQNLTVGIDQWNSGTGVSIKNLRLKPL